jgi:hypothetical protein
MRQRTKGEECDGIDISPEWDFFRCQDSPPGSSYKIKGSHQKNWVVGGTMTGKEAVDLGIGNL